MGWGTRLTVTRVSEWLNKARQRSDLGQTKVAQETNKQTSTFFPTYTCWAQCAIIWYCCSTWKRRGLKRMSFSHLTSPSSRWQKRKLWMKRQAHMLPAGESVLQLDGLRGRSDLYCLDCSVCRLPDLPGNFLLWNLDGIQGHTEKKRWIILQNCRLAREVVQKSRDTFSAISHYRCFDIYKI